MAEPGETIGTSRLVRALGGAVHEVAELLQQHADGLREKRPSPGSFVWGCQLGSLKDTFCPFETWLFSPK